MSTQLSDAAPNKKLEVFIGQSKTFDVLARLNGVPQDMTSKVPYFTAKETLSSAAVIALNFTDQPTQAFPVLPQTGDDLGRLRFVIDASQTVPLCATPHVFDVWVEEGATRDILIKPPQSGKPGGVMCVFEAATVFP